MNKEILIDAIIGKGFHSYEEASHFEGAGFATFTGNQHNPEWSWKRNALDHLSEISLKEIYSRDMDYIKPKPPAPGTTTWKMVKLAEDIVKTNLEDQDYRQL
jgi:hypothetical protein